jgi:hypothetical protein
MYAEEHRDADVQYPTLTDGEYDEMFPYDRGRRMTYDELL